MSKFTLPTNHALELNVLLVLGCYCLSSKFLCNILLLFWFLRLSLARCPVLSIGTPMELSFFKAFWVIPGTLFCTFVLVNVSSYCFIFLLFLLLLCCFNVLVPNKSINQSINSAHNDVWHCIVCKHCIQNLFTVSVQELLWKEKQHPIPIIHQTIYTRE